MRFRFMLSLALAMFAVSEFTQTVEGQLFRRGRRVNPCVVRMASPDCRTFSPQIARPGCGNFSSLAPAGVQTMVANPAPMSFRNLNSRSRPTRGYSSHGSVYSGCGAYPMSGIQVGNCCGGGYSSQVPTNYYYPVPGYPGFNPDPGFNPFMDPNFRQNPRPDEQDCELAYSACMSNCSNCQGQDATDCQAYCRCKRDMCTGDGNGPCMPHPCAVEQTGGLK